LGREEKTGIGLGREEKTGIGLSREEKYIEVGLLLGSQLHQ
jgi:hypothetical protein